MIVTTGDNKARRGSVYSGKPSLKDRTPSFYTTPEGILYGGLSVADPLPINSLNSSWSGMNDSEGHRRERADSTTSDDCGSIQVDQSNIDAHLKNIQAAQISSGEQRGESLATKLFSKINDIRISGVEEGSSNDNDDLLDSGAFLENDEQPSPANNQKTTSMANFYYRKSISSENLATHLAGSLGSQAGEGWQGY